MMSQIVITISIGAPRRNTGRTNDFFVTFAPRVWKYVSSNMSSTYLRMIEDFPTPLSPTRQILTFTRLRGESTRSVALPPGQGVAFAWETEVLKGILVRIAFDSQILNQPIRRGWSVRTQRAMT